jgi:hypothetical protein
MILDCRGLSAKNMDWKLLRMAAPILENNYPERQFATYVLPVVRTVLHTTCSHIHCITVVSSVYVTAC